MRGRWAAGIEPRNFAWILKDQLAVSERPGGFAPHHRRVRRQEEILWLSANGFTRVVSLLPSNHNLHAYVELHLPAAHFALPAHGDARSVLAELYAALSAWLHADERVLLHQDELGEQVAGVAAGFLCWAGILPEPPRAVSAVEQLLRRQMGHAGRSLVAQAAELPTGSRGSRDRADRGVAAGPAAVGPEADVPADAVMPRADDGTGEAEVLELAATPPRTGPPAPATAPPVAAGGAGKAALPKTRTGKAPPDKPAAKAPAAKPAAKAPAAKPAAKAPAAKPAAKAPAAKPAAKVPAAKAPAAEASAGKASAPEPATAKTPAKKAPKATGGAAGTGHGPAPGETPSSGKAPGRRPRRT